MSDLSEQSAQQDPSNYAPRWLRDQKVQQSLSTSESREKGEIKPELAGHGVGRGPALDLQLENAVFESLRHSLDPEVMPEPPGFFERSADRRLVARVAGFALAIGVSVAVALLIAIMIPAVRQPSATMANSAPAAPGVSRIEEESKPALAEFRGLLATSGQANRSSAQQHRSGQLLQQFLEWRDKASLNDSSQ
jgi:hypothetical protein